MFKPLSNPLHPIERVFFEEWKDGFLSSAEYRIPEKFAKYPVVAEKTVAVLVEPAGKGTLTSRLVKALIQHNNEYYMAFIWVFIHKIDDRTGTAEVYVGVAKPGDFDVEMTLKYGKKPASPTTLRELVEWWSLQASIRAGPKA